MAARLIQHTWLRMINHTMRARMMARAGEDMRLQSPLINNDADGPAGRGSARCTNARCACALGQRGSFDCHP